MSDAICDPIVSKKIFGQLFDCIDILWATGLEKATCDLTGSRVFMLKRQDCIRLVFAILTTKHVRNTTCTPLVSEYFPIVTEKFHTFGTLAHAVALLTRDL